MNAKPHILLTNDDGIHAKGLKHLWMGLKEFATITIVAPTKERSGSGLGITLSETVELHSIDWDKDVNAWAVGGTPADCVKMAMSILLKNPPDLIVSGINQGSNAGRNLLYSGTVGGAIEGVMRSIPGIAISCTELVNPNFEAAEKCVHSLVKYILAHPLPTGTLLNVNVPSHPEKPHGIRMARQGLSYWLENPTLGSHPEGITSYWMGGKQYWMDEHADSDIALLSQGYITAVPIYVNELTHHEEFAAKKSTFDQWPLFS